MFFNVSKETETAVFDVSSLIMNIFKAFSILSLNFRAVFKT